MRYLTSLESGERPVQDIAVLHEHSEFHFRAPSLFYVPQATCFPQTNCVFGLVSSAPTDNQQRQAIEETIEADEAASAKTSRRVGVGGFLQRLGSMSSSLSRHTEVRKYATNGAMIPKVTIEWLVFTVWKCPCYRVACFYGVDMCLLRNTVVDHIFCLGVVDMPSQQGPRL